MGTRPFLELFVEGVMLAALLVAASVHAQQLPPPAPTSLLEPLRFDTAAMIATFHEGSSEYGVGLVVGRAGADLLIATAGHVVIDDEGLIAVEVEVSLLSDETGATVRMPGRVLDAERLEGDIAFVAVTPPAPQPIYSPVVTPQPPVNGDPVWILGGINGGKWSPTPGIVSASNTNPTSLYFVGGGAEVGVSGAPLVGYSGVVGLVRATPGSGTYATPIAHVRALFDRHHAGAWTWALETRAALRRAGQVRLRRLDELSATFPAQIMLAGPQDLLPLTVNRPTPVPVGSYTVELLRLSGRRSDLRCEPDRIDVPAYPLQDLNLLCTVDPTGNWRLADGRMVRIAPQSGGIYPVTVLDASGAEIGSGTAGLRDDLYLTLNVSDSTDGVWSAEAKIGFNGARGRASLLELGTEQDFLMIRPLDVQ